VTDLDTYRPTSNDPATALVQWAHAAQSAFQLAQSLVGTNVCPPQFRGKPQEATAVILLGAELGLSPIHALRAMFDIRGTIGMYVRAQVALVQSRGHRVWTESESDDAVTVCGYRAGDENHVERVTWTIQRARQAGLIRRGSGNAPSQYELQPRVMLWSRAAGEVARRIAADVLAGIPEMDDPRDAPQAGTGDPATPARVIQRRPAQPRQVDDVELPADVPMSESSGQVDDAPPPPQESATHDDGAPADTVPPPDEENPALLGDAEPLITRAQMNKLQATFIRLGVRTPDQRHAYLTRWLDRPVASTNDITVTEASAILDRLEAQANGDA
jgi:hypothetical protein